MLFSQNNLTKNINDVSKPNSNDPRTLGLVSLFNGISNFVDYLMPKLFSEKNSSDTI